MEGKSVRCFSWLSIMVVYFLKYKWKVLKNCRELQLQTKTGPKQESISLLFPSKVSFCFDVWKKWSQRQGPVVYTLHLIQLEYKSVKLTSIYKAIHTNGYYKCMTGMENAFIPRTSYFSMISKLADFRKFMR